MCMEGKTEVDYMYVVFGGGRGEQVAYLSGGREGLDIYQLTCTGTGKHTQVLTHPKTEVFQGSYEYY